MTDRKFSLVDLNNETASALNDAEIGVEPIDRVAEVERLASLDPMEYEAARNDAADRLAFRASVLDNEVKKKRRAA